MASFTRKSPRIAETQDLSARLRGPQERWSSVRVLNLSEGGMLLDGLLPHGRRLGHAGPRAGVEFELVGPNLRCAGTAEVVHRTGGATGVRFLSWRGPGRERLREIVVARTGRAFARASEAAPPGVYLG